MKGISLTKGLFLVLTLMLAASAAYAQTTSVVLDSTATNLVLDYDNTNVDGTLRPGGSAILQVVVKNTGLYAAEDVILYIPGTADVSVNKQWFLGDIVSGQTKTVTTTINAAAGAKIGLYPLQVKLSYDGYDTKGRRQADQSQSYDVPVRIVGEANFQLTAKKADFYSGVKTNLVLSGTAGNEAKDVTVKISSDCASIIGSDKTVLGAISKGKSFELEYMTQPSEAGICPLTLSMTYTDASGASMTESIEVGIDVKRYDVDFKIISVETINATPGASGVIKVGMENVGSAAAKDATVSLEFSDPLTAVGSSERYVGEVASHETLDVEFRVLVDSEAGIKAYTVPMKVEYYDDSGSKNTLEKSIGLEISGKPDIKLVLEESSLFTSGTKGKVTVDVVNKGFAEVKFLNIKLLSTEDYDVLSSSEYYIGNLDSDSTDSQDFDIQVKSSAKAGKIPLKVEVSYKERNSNVDHVEVAEIELNVLSMEEYARRDPAGSPLAMVLGLVGTLLGVIVAVVGIWFVIKLILAIIHFLDRLLFKKKKE